MRKLTGYIGAMIIVFALMGSILAGYALNINSDTAVINEYDPVTDVSGLYAHSDEKTYIDYNPASNYIGYENGETRTFDNTTVRDSTYRKITSYSTIEVKTDGVYINGEFTGDARTYLPYYAFICDDCYLYYESNGTNLTFYTSGAAVNHITTTVTITVFTNNSVTVNVNDTNYNFTNVSMVLACDQTDTADYICGLAQISPSDTPKTVYLNNAEQVIYNTTDPSGIGVGKYWLNRTTGQTFSNKTIVTKTNDVFGDVGEYTIVNQDKTWGFFYPKTVTANKTDTGINYIESPRVNNYPVEYDYNTETSTVNTSVDLTALSATNRYTLSSGINLGGGNSYRWYDSQTFFQANGYYFVKNGIKEYLLKDILDTLIIPTGTTSIRFDYSYSLAYATATVPVPGTAYTLDVPGPYYNASLMSIYPVQNMGSELDVNRTITYAVYTISNDTLEIYNRYDQKIWTSGINQGVIRFVNNSTTTGVFDYNYTGHVNNNDINGTSQVNFNLASRNSPILNITFNVTGVVSDTHYMDITKGVSIKDTNVNNTTWNNSYENSNIQIVFRAENIASTYSNDLTIAGNNINIEFDGGRYYVTLGTNDPVDIGAWRNIVLDIDLINKQLSVIPVKTFNSYTNVELLNTEIVIGELVGASPSSDIIWAPTSESLTFSVYSTRVFMDTYGVVMVDPSLNINNYFTDLNNFYRLEFRNFSVYGNSMTINGITAPVVNGTVTFNDEKIRLNDIKVSYANNHVYIADNNTSIDLGEIATTDISFDGAWYFVTDLLKGYTSLKTVYNWDWSDFILDNIQFCIFYIGLALVGLVIARKYCNLSIVDYMVFIASVIIALTVNVIA